MRPDLISNSNAFSVSVFLLLLVSSSVALIPSARLVSVMWSGFPWRIRTEIQLWHISGSLCCLYFLPFLSWVCAPRLCSLSPRTSFNPRNVSKSSAGTCPEFSLPQSPQQCLILTWSLRNSLHTPGNEQHSKWQITAQVRWFFPNKSDH